MDGRTIATVRILGEEYRIQGDSDSEEISRLAAYVDQALRQLMEASPISDPKRLAVIASVNIAQQLFRERKEAAALLEKVGERIERLTDKVDGALEETTWDEAPAAVGSRKA
jgi:cell division protein ZapA